MIDFLLRSWLVPLSVYSANIDLSIPKGMIQGWGVRLGGGVVPVCYNDRRTERQAREPLLVVVGYSRKKD